MSYPLRELGKVCKFVRGPFGGSLKKDIFIKEGYAVYEQQHAIYNQFSEIRYFINEEKFNEMSRFELFSNDLIMSCSGTMGKVAIVPSGIKKGVINQALLKLTPNGEIDVVYLKWLMTSSYFQEELVKLSVGAAIQNVASVATLKKIKIPLPPLAIQKKIVTKLDAISAEIDKAITVAEANAKNAEALFQSYLTKIFERSGSVWDTKKLKDITYKITDGSHNPPKGIDHSDFLMFSSKNISNDKITFDSPRFLSKDDYELENKRTQVSFGDVLLTIVGTIGRCAVVADANLKITLQRSVSVIKPKSEINSRFLMYFFLSINKFLNERARGVAQKGIYLETLRDLDIHFPNINEQQLLVTRLDDLSSKLKSISNGYRDKAELLSSYKQSILRQAFSGELVKE